MRSRDALEDGGTGCDGCRLLQTERGRGGEQGEDEAAASGRADLDAGPPVPQSAAFALRCPRCEILQGRSLKGWAHGIGVGGRQGVVEVTPEKPVNDEIGPLRRSRGLSAKGQGPGSWPNGPPLPVWEDRLLHLPRTLARINRRVINPIQLRWAGVIPAHGIVEHRGRRTGRTYRTPVLVFAGSGGFWMIVGYGIRSDWVQNLLAAGGADLEHRRRHFAVSNPRLLRRTDGYGMLPFALRLFARVARVEAALRVDAEPVVRESHDVP